jgi:hypothetical protein
MGRLSAWTTTIAPNQRATVKLTTAGELGCAVNYQGAQVSTLGADCYGILMQNGAIGEFVPIVVGDEAVARAGGAVAVGAELTAAANGRLVTAATGNFIIARALESASADGEYIRVDVGRENKK